MVKVISFLLLLALAVWAAWHFGVLQSVGGAFDDWLNYIGLSRDNEPMRSNQDWKGTYWDKPKR